MLVLLACVSQRENIEQTNSKKRKTSNPLYAARVLCRDFEQNSPERHKSTHWGTLFVAGGHWKTSKATLKQLALAMSSQKAPTISIFDSLDRQTLKQRAQSFFCSLQIRPEATDSCSHVPPRARWQGVGLDLPESDGQASKTAIRAWKGALSAVPIFGKRSKMVDFGRHVIQS